MIMKKIGKKNLKGLGGIISPENLYDCFYDAYFKTWLEYPKVSTGSAKYAFIAPNDPVSSSRFVLEEGFNIKIIFVSKDLEGQIISRSLRLHRRNSQNIKNLKLEKYILNGIAENKIKKNIEKIITEMNELKNIQTKYILWILMNL